MNDWTAGYVAEIGYTHGYYAELNPLRVQLAFVHAGLAYPDIRNACELGFGQGISLNLHASASIAQWHGTDFNPSHAAFAQQLASASGNNAELSDQAFDEFCVRPDLPDFDFIGLHGIWSWVSDHNRHVIVDFIRRRLRVGGVLYVSYNTYPGWASLTPFRDLLADHAAINGSIGQGVVARIDGALAFAEKVLGTKPLYARANPQVMQKLKQIKDENRNYVAHEYFNRDFYPFSFTRIAECLAPSKTTFACSAHYLDHVVGINTTPEQQALLDEISNAEFRQTVRDFCINQNFRKDYWVRGARRLNPMQQMEALRAIRVILINARADVTLKVKGILGEVDMNAAIYNRVLDAMADQQPKTLGEMERAFKGQGVNLAELQQAVMTLVGKGDVALAYGDEQIAECKVKSDRYNSHVIRSARTSNEIRYLASPVTGGGIPADRMQLLFLLALSEGRNVPEDWAQLALQVLLEQGKRLIKDGKTLDSKEENIAELKTMARDFAERRLPVLRALGAVSGTR
jgi:SAM-dependent methyltransferase